MRQLTPGFWRAANPGVFLIVCVLAKVLKGETKSMDYADELERAKAEIKKVLDQISKDYVGKWLMTTPKKKTFKYERREKPVPFKVNGVEFKSTKVNDTLAYMVVVFWGFADPDNKKVLRRATHLVKQLPDPFDTRDSALLYREICDDD